MRWSVRLHPVTVMLSLIVGAALAGFFGMLVAVPIVASIKVVAAHLWRTRVPWGEEVFDATTTEELARARPAAPRGRKRRSASDRPSASASPGTSDAPEAPYAWVSGFMDVGSSRGVEGPALSKPRQPVQRETVREQGANAVPRDGDR